MDVFVFEDFTDFPHRDVPFFAQLLNLPGTMRMVAEGSGLGSVLESTQGRSGKMAGFAELGAEVSNGPIGVYEAFGNGSQREDLNEGGAQDFVAFVVAGGGFLEEFREISHV